MNYAPNATQPESRRRRGFACAVFSLGAAIVSFAAGACGQAPQPEKLAAPSDPQTRRAGEDWKQWRGPRSNGIAAQTTLPAAWPAAPFEPRWRVPLGEGWSSPVVAGGRVYTVDRKDAVERSAAYDADTGKLLWERTSPVDFDPHQVGRRHGNGPKSTPAYADGLVYTLGISGRLQCFKADIGEPVWKSFFPEQFGTAIELPDGRAYVVGEDHVVVPIAAGSKGESRGAPVPLFGYTGSPLVFGEFLIAATGGTSDTERRGTITAFERRTGKVAWQALDEHVSYSSPVSAEFAGVRQVVVPTGPNLVGLELATGKKLWSVPYQIQYDETIGTPVVAGDLVLITATGQPLSAWRIAKNAAGEFTATEAWSNQDLSSYLSSMVVVGDYVYGMNDGGEFHCLKLADGKTIWRGGSHGYYTTPLVAGDRILVLNERGKLDVITVNPEKYEPIASLQVAKEYSWTSPAIVGNRIYIRSQRALMCFELK